MREGLKVTDIYLYEKKPHTLRLITTIALTYIILHSYILQ